MARQNEATPTASNLVVTSKPATTRRRTNVHSCHHRLPGSAVRPTCIRITRLVLKAPNTSVVKWVVRAVTIMHRLAVGLGWMQVLQVLQGASGPILP